jgi:hypothetical protein
LSYGCSSSGEIISFEDEECALKIRGIVAQPLVPPFTPLGYRTMKIPALTIAAALITIAPLHAQDLQWQAVMTSTMPAAGMDLRTKTTISLKGKKVRMDNRIETPTGEMEASVITDGATGKSYVLMHEARTYMDMPNPMDAAKKLWTDSAAMRKVEAETKFIRTGEVTKLIGYDVERVIVYAPFPAGIPHMPTTKPAWSISEMWIAKDRALNKAYMPFVDKFSALWSGGLPLSAEWNELKAFPLKMTVLVVERETGVALDPIAVLKEQQPSGLVMRVVTEVSQVKLGPLDQLLFELPADYSKGQ